MLATDKLFTLVSLSFITYFTLLSSSITSILRSTTPTSLPLFNGWTYWTTSPFAFLTRCLALLWTCPPTTTSTPFIIDIAYPAFSAPFTSVVSSPYPVWAKTTTMSAPSWFFIISVYFFTLSSISSTNISSFNINLSQFNIWVGTTPVIPIFNFLSSPLESTTVSSIILYGSNTKSPLFESLILAHTIPIVEFALTICFM